MSSRADVVFRALAWLVGTVLLWRIPRCGEAGLRPKREPLELSPAVSVIIPARNEALRLPALLRSLMPQVDSSVQVLVVDDHSTDGTGRLAESFGARVIAVGEPPPGWTGKTWACWTGAQAAKGGTFVFLDADTMLQPGGLGRLVGEHASVGGLLSVQPYHVMDEAYERLSAVFNLIMMMGTLAFTPLGARLVPRAAFGPCLLCSRSDYFAVGGHQSVRGYVLEDLALSRMFSSAGLPVRCLGGRETITLRMYGGGPRHLLGGWSRNVANGAGPVGILPFCLVFCWFTGCAGAAIGLVQSLGRGHNTRRQGRTVALALYCGYSAQMYWMLRRVGQFGWWPAALYPVPLLTFLVTFIYSIALKVFVGRVRWRGREVPS